MSTHVYHTDALGRGCQIPRVTPEFQNWGGQGRRDQIRGLKSSLFTLQIQGQPRLNETLP